MQKQTPTSPSHFLASAFVALLLLLSSCGADPEAVATYSQDPTHYHKAVKKLTDVIVHDIFSPPVASRIYAYPAIAAYEIVAQDEAAHPSLSGTLNGLQPIPKAPAEKINRELAALYAYLETGKKLVFSEEKIAAYQQELVQGFAAAGVRDAVLKTSKSYGEQVAAHIMAWANTDNYNETRTFPKFTVTSDPSRWQPTPPDYMEGIEPHWMKIRPFLLDSADQFVPPPPTPFSTDPESEFYQEVMEVYDAVNKLSEEQLEIAQFWDCNPYVSQHKGHAMFALKKITPGGHWIGITSIACRTAGAGFAQSVKTYAWVSIALADAFISCWDEKYRSSLVRPETVINQHIDEDWLPILQTPPFPEYTSGHSVISAAAAVVLTEIYGEDFAFTDSTEVEYGLTVRKYGSFKQASEEAAISRLYGGIHYMPAISNGVKQGKEVGRFVAEKLKNVSANPVAARDPKEN